MSSNQLHPDSISQRLDACFEDPQALAALLADITSVLPILQREADTATVEQLARVARFVAFGRHMIPPLVAVQFVYEVIALGFPVLGGSRLLDLSTRYVEIAEASGDKAAFRRACNTHGLMCTESGNGALGIEFLQRATELAAELNDEVGVSSALGNLTATLYTMGLYRETIAAALRVISKFQDHPRCKLFVAAARCNLASSAMALQNHSLCFEAAESAVVTMPLPKTAHDILNTIIIRGVWLRAAIALKRDDVVSDCLAVMRDIASAYSVPRVRFNMNLTEAAVDIYHGRLAVATARLLRLLEETRGVFPSLYRDTLNLLVRAHEQNDDHAGALLYLGELVDGLSRAKVYATRQLLESISGGHQTTIPGVDDTRALLTSMQGSPPAPRSNGSVPEGAYREAFERLAITSELREDALGLHVYRVGKLSALLALSLDYGQIYADAIDRAARLHDIGKLGIPDGIMIKAGRLTEAEFSVMQRHTRIGGQILAQCAHPAFRLAEEIAINHHERWNGKGYPAGLLGEQIPIAARIVAVAEVYDSLTHTRSYKHAWRHCDAVSEMTRLSGSHFEPRVVDAFLRIIESLHAEHGDGLDAFLASAASSSALVQSRESLRALLDRVAPRDVTSFYPGRTAA